MRNRFASKAPPVGGAAIAAAHRVDQAPAKTDRARGKDFLGRFEVQDSEDLRRILELPRRPIPNADEQRAMAAIMTARLRLERTTPCECAALRPEVVARGQSPCITELNPIQGWYLWEASQALGVVGPITVGGGKTGVDILLAMVVPGCRVAVLMIPPGLKPTLLREFAAWRQHFRVPNLAGDSQFVPDGRPVLEVLKYTELSNENFGTWLKARKPDILICDEVQALGDIASVRTDRFLRYCVDASEGTLTPGVKEDAREIRLFCHSASLTTREIQQVTHLSAISLRDGSPFPLDPKVAEEWGEHLNPNVKSPAPPGALKKFLRHGDKSVRVAFGRFIAETLGVVSTEDASIPTRIQIREADAGEIPQAVKDALARARGEHERPDGHELIDQLEIAEVCRELAYGFFYRWRYPRGESAELIAEWFDKRKAWAKELRDRMLFRVDGLDSPALLTDAADRAATGYKGKLPVWHARTWKDWKDIRESVQPEKGDAVWVDPWLAQRAADWAAEGPGIIWYEHRAFGERVQALSGLRRYGGGPKAATEIERETGQRSVIASRKAHGTGRNLQSFWRLLFANLPSDGGAWEQTIGRCHRFGQPAELVRVDVFQHTSEVRGAFEKAQEYAAYMHEIQRNPQKLCFADILIGKARA